MRRCPSGVVSPDAAYDGAYMDIARAAGELRPNGSAAGLGVIKATAETVNDAHKWPVTFVNDSDISSVKLKHAPAENPFARSDEYSEDEQKGIAELKEDLIAAGQYEEDESPVGLRKNDESGEQPPVGTGIVFR